MDPKMAMVLVLLIVHQFVQHQTLNKKNKKKSKEQQARASVLRKEDDERTFFLPGFQHVCHNGVQKSKNKITHL